MNIPFNMHTKRFGYIRSYVPRDGRMTESQHRAMDQLWPQFGISADQGVIDFQKLFGRYAPHILEIGFGTGQSLVHAAQVHPEEDFIGIETHKPGIGSLLLAIERHQIKNVRIYYGDAVGILQNCIPQASLDRVHLFFPDPWPKRRHYKRRLIQKPFVQLIMNKLKQRGVLYIATDWEAYAEHIQSIFISIPDFEKQEVFK